MSIDEFQKLLKSDFVQENKKLERRICELECEINEKDKMLRVQFNRCYTMMPREMCWFCTMGEECKKLREVFIADGRT